MERKVYSGRHLGLIEIMGIVFFGIITTYAVYHELDIRGLMFVGILLLMGELFTQLKWRTSMVCRNCGFDPVVYVRNPEAAGLKIKAFLENRSESPEHLLRPPVIIPKKNANKGKNLSLKI